MKLFSQAQVSSSPRQISARCLMRSKIDTKKVTASMPPHQRAQLVQQVSNLNLIQSNLYQLHLATPSPDKKIAKPVIVKQPPVVIIVPPMTISKTKAEKAKVIKDHMAQIEDAEAKKKDANKSKESKKGKSQQSKPASPIKKAPDVKNVTKSD